MRIQASADALQRILTGILAAGVLFCSACLPLAVFGQDAAPKTPAPASSAQDIGQPASEMTTTDLQTPFRVRVNVVLVRAVVRDATGRVVENLKKEDFRLFDNRKEQNVSSFTMETPEKLAIEARPAGAAEDPANAPEPGAAPGVVMPQRYVALVFDDLHLTLQDAVTLRAAASHVFGALQPSDRLGIYSTSGQTTQEFTSDAGALKRSLDGLVPRGLAERHEGDCPPMTYYQADLIVNHHDRQALLASIADALACMPSQTTPTAAESAAQVEAQRTLSEGDVNTQYAYRRIEDVLRRLSGMPGQRVMLFASPGFLYTADTLDFFQVIDRALRSNAVIDTLDARGLYTPDILGDIAEHEQPLTNPRTRGLRTSYRVVAQNEQSRVLGDFAAGTGGTYFHNRNDLDEGLRQTIAAPPVSYLLSFTPQNLKLDGRFHSITVKLVNGGKYTVQARHGYYAPRTLPDPREQAKAEIQEAIFSQEEMQGVPVELQTQFFKPAPAQARLAVLAHLDLKSVRFRKTDGRNRDDVTVATAIFDQNGNFVTGGEKIVEMKLLDPTYERLSRSGITVKSSFDVKPGTYLVRLVVRDSEGEQMAARNGAVTIPY